MVRTNWEAVFEKYKKNYIKIFNVIYPSKRSTGFTERNLSVNFARAYEELYPEAITWFEFSFEHGKHFDAVIVNPITKEIVIVESKRFTNPKAKCYEIDNDIGRIINFTKTIEKELKERLNNYNTYSLVGVIIADVWTETEEKVSIKKLFETKEYLKTRKYSTIESPLYFCKGFKDEIFKEEIGKKHNSIRLYYNLVGIVWVL